MTTCCPSCPSCSRSSSLRLPSCRPRTAPRSAESAAASPAHTSAPSCRRTPRASVVLPPPPLLFLLLALPVRDPHRRRCSPTCATAGAAPRPAGVTTPTSRAPTATPRTTCPSRGRATSSCRVATARVARCASSATHPSLSKRRSQPPPLRLPLRLPLPLHRRQQLLLPPIAVLLLRLPPPRWPPLSPLPRLLARRCVASAVDRARPAATMTLPNLQPLLRAARRRRRAGVNQSLVARMSASSIPVHANRWGDIQAEEDEKERNADAPAHRQPSPPVRFSSVASISSPSKPQRASSKPPASPSATGALARSASTSRAERR